MYDRGEGVPQDYVEAAKWYRQAAEQNLTDAQFNLGLKFDRGQGVGQNHIESAKLYRMAAEEFGDAQFNLGLKYAYGRGVARDFAKAHFWFSVSRYDSNDSGNYQFAEARELVMHLMTPTQLEVSERLLQEWDAEHSCCDFRV